MAELPEIETLRREIERDVVGKRIKAVEVAEKRAVGRHSSMKDFIGRLEGVKILGTSRVGSLLMLELDNDEVLVADVTKGGNLVRAAGKDEPVEGTTIVITFTQQGQLRLIDPLGAGELAVMSPDDVNIAYPELDNLGIDPIDKPMSWTVFGDLLLKNKMRLKDFLTDPKIIVGIGPLYSDEILFSAGLRYDRPSDSLSTQEIRRLYRALVETLHDAVKHRGSSIGDVPFVDLHGEPGDYQSLHQVYNLDKKACRRCRAPIARAKIGGRWTYFCKQCQV